MFKRLSFSNFYRYSLITECFSPINYKNNLYFHFRYLSFPSSIRWRVISVVLSVLAVLSKETGIMAMVINISVAILNYVMENVSLTTHCNLTKKDLEKVGQRPIISKIRRRKQTAALKRISTDIAMVSIF